MTKKPGKNRPVEAPISKAPVSVLRQPASLPMRPKPVDPRFDRSFGHFNPDLFSKAYDFVGEIQEKETGALREALGQEADPRRREQIRRTIDRRTSTLNNMKRQSERKEAIKQWKQKEADLVAKGKKPFYLKKNDVDKLVLQRQYERLKEAHPGKPLDIDKAVEKRRKRKASRQHRRLPYATE